MTQLRRSNLALFQKLFAGAKSIRLVYSDIDVAADVDLYCDAHELPFQDQTFDGVIASAVLEHVLSPNNGGSRSPQSSAT